MSAASAPANAAAASMSFADRVSDAPVAACSAAYARVFDGALHTRDRRRSDELVLLERGTQLSEGCERVIRTVSAENRRGQFAMVSLRFTKHHLEDGDRLIGCVLHVLVGVEY